MTFQVSFSPPSSADEAGNPPSGSGSGRSGRARTLRRHTKLWPVLTRPARFEVVTGDLALAEAALGRATLCHPAANAALMGDKRILFSASGASFLSYGVRGRTWLALAGPVGRAEEADELVQRFLSSARQARARAAFYAAGPDFAGLAHRHHLRMLKIGERALLDLPDFSMAGKDRQVIRTHRNRHIKQGWTVTVDGPGAARPLAPVLRGISDDWLSQTNGSEKSFALGRFDIAYLDRLPLATVRGPDGSIAAFASLWPSADRSRIGVDLMRYSAQAPSGVMDYLFAELFLWAQGQGYRIFDLNTAPLAGVSFDPSAPVVTGLATLAYEHGEKLYNFKGVRRFKKKFHPRWEDVFLAAPRGVSPLTALASAAILINRAV
jgi:lysylphosphatidylglycerol synthetase-like protein (DUF2156 family)